MSSVERLTELAKTLPETERARVIGYIEGLPALQTQRSAPQTTIGICSNNTPVAGRGAFGVRTVVIVRPFADTNLAVYGLDADPTRRAKALSVMRARPVISVQVVNEFLPVVIRKGRLPRETAMRLARILLNRCEVAPVTRKTVEMALELGDRYQLSHWDALMVAAALVADCDPLFSEDLQHGQVFSGQLTVVNPFH